MSAEDFTKEIPCQRCGASPTREFIFPMLNHAHPAFVRPERHEWNERFTIMGHILCEVCVSVVISRTNAFLSGSEL